MSVEPFKDVLDTTKAEPNDEVSSSFVDNTGITGQEPSINPAMLQLFPFGCSGAKVDFTSTSTAWCFPDGVGESAFGGEKTQRVSSMDWDLPVDGAQTPSSWPSSSTPSGYSLFPCESTPPSSITSHSQDSHSDINQNGLFFANGGGETKGVSTDMEGELSSERDPSTDLSLEGSGVFDPHTARRESTQPHSAPAGWTYRQMLEIVALPPPEGLHLWHTKISQLAVDLGMPIWATGRDIVSFVLYVASVKNELHRVVPLIKALAAAARVLEGRIPAPTTLLPVVLAVYPNTVPLSSVEPVGAESKTARKRSHDEISESVPGEEEDEDCEYDDEDDDADADDADVDEPTFRRPRFTEEDLYCRVGNCLWAFKDSRVCAKHRLRHFPDRWVCPGPCKGDSAQGGGARFARSETLKRHLLFPKNAPCVETVLNVLNLETIPESGTAWLAPLRDGPERPWEDPDFQLTDLKTVKDEKMKLRSSGSAELPDVPTATGRRRYK